MKTTRKLIVISASFAMVVAGVSVGAASIVKADKAPKEFTSKITPTSPGKGETVSFLPKSVSDFYTLPNLAETYIDKFSEIKDLLPYSTEAGQWAGYTANPATYPDAIRLYDKYDLCRPTNNLLSWNSEVDAKQYRVIISQDDKFSNIEREYTVGGDESSVKFENPYTGVKYYWQVIATKNDNSEVFSDIFSFNVAELPRAIYIPGISNTRDLGGMKNSNGERMIQGLVYRGNKLEPTTQEGRNEFINNLGIKTEIDLRSEGEGNANALGLSSYYFCPSPYDAVFADLEKTQPVKDWPNIAYTDDAANSFCKSFGNAIKAMADVNNYPVYFHCSVGRDRTGWLGLCLDFLCGMSEETSLKEFLLSLFSCAGMFEKDSTEFYNRFKRIRDYMNTFEGKTLSERTEDYLVKHCGVTHEDCDKVRNILLGKTPTGFVPGKVNEDSYEGYSKVTFKQYGQESIIKLVENGNKVSDPHVSGNGAWYCGDKLWNFDEDVITSDTIISYIDDSKNKVVVHFIGIEQDDDILNLADGEILTFESYAREGYTFKVYDSDFIEIDSAVISDDVIFNIVYKSTSPLTPKQNSRVIVMAGQSNAAGVGHYQYLKDSLPEEKIKEINHGFDNVLMRGYSHRPMDEFRPVYADEDYNTCTGPGTFGFEVSLADRLSKIYPDETVYIVKYALGASNLGYDWCPPSGRDITHSTSGASGGELGCLYDGMVKSIHESLDWIKANTNTYPVIDAFMWMQGESGALTYSYLDEYIVLWDCFINDFKQEFKNDFGYKFAFYDAAIATHELWSLAKEVNQVKKDHASDDYIYIDTVEKGYTTKYEPFKIPDVAHYDAGCYFDLGHYFADSYIQHYDKTYKPNVLDVEVPDRYVVSFNDSTTQIEPVVKYNGNEVTSDVKFFSRDPSILTIDENGIITPTGVGATFVKVQTYYGDEIITKEVAVRVFEGNLDDVPLLTLKDESRIHYSGRNILTDDNVTFINTLSGFETTFVGDCLKAKMIGVKGDMYYIPASKTLSLRVYVDDDKEGKIINVPLLSSSSSDYSHREIVLAEFDEVGQHTIKVQKINYERRGYIEMSELYGPSKFLETRDTRKKALILGDSITVGCGINGKGSYDTFDNEDGTLTYAAQFVNEHNFNAQVICVTGISLGAPVYWRRTMADIYKQYSYSDTDEYDMSSFIPDVVLLNLGTNDAGALLTQPNQYGDYRTADDIYNGTMTIVKGLREVYKTSSILFTMGMMGYDNIVASSIQRAISEYSLLVTNKYDSLQGFMKYDLSETSSNYGGHPTPNCHKKAFEQLNKNSLIKTALGL